MTRRGRGAPDAVAQRPNAEARAPRPSPEPQAARPIRFDWRDTMTHAADLALLGIVTTVAMLPVVTAGAAVATASAAIHDWLPAQHWPEARTTFARFGRGVLPGLGAGAAALALAVLVSLDLTMVAGGSVPGGPPMVVATAIVGVLATGVAALAAVAVGRTGGRGWRAALGWAARTSYDRPAAPLALAGVIVLAGLLASLMPLITPLALGYAFFALHVVARRLAPADA